MNNMKLTKNDIRNIIPHRSPILLADSAELGDNYAATSFYADPEMAVFEGHFPAGPVLPGVYIIEAMAQCADIFLLFPEANRNLTPLLTSVQQIRLFRPVSPGDTLSCHAEIILPEDGGSPLPSPSGMYDFRVSASSDGKKIAQGIITLCLK